MSKFYDALGTYQKEMTETLGFNEVNEVLLKEITKHLGPSIYLPDASKVSCSEASELTRVKKNFLVKKLKLENGPELDKAIQEVCEVFGSSSRKKYRAIFYYLLTQKFNKEEIFLRGKS